jgi:hypothetical protein
VAPVSRSISHTASLREALRGGAKYIGLPGITEDVMCAADVNPDGLAKITEEVGG